MISRIRLEASGTTMGDVDSDLRDLAKQVRDLFWRPVLEGEHVYERQMGEPAGADTAYKGRLILHPDISTVPQMREGPQPAPDRDGQNG